MACKYTYNGVEYSKEQLVSKLGNENSNFNTLYNNLVNEITSTETGRKILDRIKRDYVNKGIEPFNKWVNRNINASYVYKNDNSDYEKYVIKEYFEKTSKSLDELYTLEEQQEEAIVELLGMMTAEKLDNVKDGKLISLLKRLLKEIKAFVKDLFKQREIEIDKLPDNMTLGDLSDLLAYSNSKLILPGYEVEYTTPDNTKFKTYAEASKHISNLVKGVKDVDLSNIKINEFNNIPDEFETPGGIAFKKDGKYYLKELYPNFDEKGNFIDETENIIEISNDRFISQYKDSFDYHLYDKNLSSFIERNKEYEQSKDIIEEWKKINNIQYNPEEIYSRGQEFTSVVGAYSSFDVNLMMQNLLTHIEDNEKAGGKFAISAYTKPVDKQIGHLEGGGGKIKFKIYPKSEDILWASNVDVYSGSVWDASEKINKDKKSELLGVSYTKYPALNNVNTVQPNLAAIIDNIAHHHNELGIVLTGNNFRLEYDEDIPHQTKKIIDNINAILDYRYGKLAKPNINKPVLQKVFAVFYQSEVMEDDGAFSHYEDVTMKRFDNEKDAQDFIDSDTRHYNYRIKSYNQERTLVGIQPKQTNETLKESINSVKDSILKDSYKEIKGWGLVVNDKTINNKEYTSQALINTKIAALKEVAKKYPRSLIRSEVKSISDSNLQNNKLFDDELPFQKIPGQEASSIYELTQPEQYEQRASFSELSDFIRKETKLGKVTATDTTVLKRLLSSSSKLVFGTYYFDRSGDTDVFETSDKSTISYVTDSSLYSKINNRPIQEIFSIYGHTAMETKLGIMSSIVERLHSDNFNGKLFRYINSRVGGVEIRIVENTGKGMFVSDNNLYIDLQGVSNTIVNNNISDISEYLDTVLSEELIHLVVDSYITNEDYQNIYNETPKNIIDGIQQVYMFADPTVNIVVDEYLRMLIQDHFFGKTTELIKNQNVEITQPFLYQIFINTWEFIRDFFKKEYPRYTKQVVDKSIEMINESQGDYFKDETSVIPPNEQVVYKMRVINALQSNKVREPKLDNLQGFYNDLLKQGIPNQQIDLVKDILSDVKGKVTKEDLIRELLVRYSYSVEVNTAMVNSEAKRIAQREDIDYEDAVGYAKSNNQTPASYYSDLTVPGGTNYTENEIKTPGITPSITGHAQFSTKEGIGWFRSDDKGVEILDKYIPADDILLKEYKEFDYPFSFEEYKQGRLNNISVIPEYTTNSKTRRILEVQSDLFQKGRDKEFLSAIPKDETLDNNDLDILAKSPQNKFLQLLNKDNNWANFFIKSIIQDSAKRGYEKVLFPTGNTASKIEGHQSLEEFKKQKQDRIDLLEHSKIDDSGHEYFFDKNTNVYRAETNEGERHIITKKLFDSVIESDIGVEIREREINQLKQELERVETEGFASLRPIFKFYEETVGNILKKNYKDKINRITDEYGNQWWELSMDRSRDLSDIMFQLSTEDVLPNEITPELKSKLHEFASALGIEISVLDDLIERRGVNGIAQIRDFKILLQNGRESALGEEIAHFLVRLLDNESDLKKRIMEEAPRTRLYKKLRQDAGYKAAYGDNTQLFKEEVAAKLISLYLSDKELFNHWAGSDQLIENLVRWIKDFFKWLRGNTKLNSFIEASQQILDLNTSNLVLSQAADAQEMYSIAEFINRTQKLESVNYDIKNVDKLLINISNTILDYEGYPGDKKEKRAFIFQAGENAERDKFYSTAKLTTLGLELKDKLEFIGDKEIVFYTRMYVSPALETRLMMEFNSNIRIERTNVEQPIFDADGNYITMSDETNTLQDIIDREVAKSPNVRMLAVDNSTISVTGAQSRQYNQKTANYKPIKDGIKASYKAKEKLEINDKFKNELAQLNQGQLITKVEEAFKIINKEIQDINVLEGVLKKMGEEEVSKLFRDEYGNITLPKKPAQQAIQFIKEMNKLEKGILQFVGTIESVTAFFSERNLTNYQTVRDLIEKANQTTDKKEQDRLYENAIQELALITKMGNSWREYISQFREIIQGYPKTETVQKLLSDLEGQIDQTKRIARELSKEAVSKYLAGKSFDAINLVNKELIAHYDKILQDPGLSKEKREEVELNKSRVRIKNHEDIISIFNGDIKDIDGTTVWVKHLHNSSDSLLGSVNVMIQKAYAEVEVETMQRAQDMGAKVREQMTKANVTQKDIEDNLVISEDFYMEELQPDGSRKWVKKSRLALLNPWQNLHVRFEKKLPMDEAYSKWSEAKKARLLSEEEITNLRKDYEAKRDTFNKWENQNWNRKYLKKFNERYDELLQDERNKELLEEVKKTQQEIYSDINENTLLLQSETDLNNVDHLNSQIEDGYRQLKKLKRDTYDDGSPKVDRDLEIAKLLQKKAEIDRPFYEYSSDTKRFRNDFKVFLSTLSEIPDDVYATMLSKLEGESFSELYEYAVQSAPHQVKIWLDLFTVVRYSPEWYAKRKVVVDQITEVSNQLADAYGKNKTDLGEIWSQLFTLTSPLRDEDNILDGADATPEVQSKVLEFEKEIEQIKLLTRMEREGIYSPEIKKLKEELGKLIKDLNELQLSVTTDYYNQAFMEQTENTGFKDAFVAAYPSVPMSYQSNLLDVINTSQFRTFVNDNPDHPFVEWFKNNHLEKTSYNETGEASLTMVPTYIWYKKEPKDKKEILTLPSHKYSVRKVKEDFVTKKIDWDTWNPITKEFLPLKDNREFKNPAYTKLRTSSDSKNIGLRNILDEITKFHVSTQVNSIVQESKIGFALPSMAKQDLDNGFFKNIYNNFLDKQNRFEQGEGNYDETVEPESKKGFLNKVISWLNGWIDDKPDSNESETTKFQRIAVPYTHYMEPERVSKDILLSITMFAASTGKADRMFKSLNTFKLIEEVLENPPKLDKKGRMTGVNSNRIKSLLYTKEYHIYGVNKKYELGRGIDRTLTAIRDINTIGSLGFPFGFANTLKNNLQGRLQNLIGGRFADWSSPASMRKAAGNLNINFISWIAQSEVEPSKRTLDFHIINYMNPQLSGDIYQHLFSGAGKRIAKDRHIYLLNEGMEFSISVNLLYGHLYHVKVKNEKGEQKTLYDILEFKDGKIRPKEGWITLKGERVVDDQYLLDTKLAYKTAAEYIQGKVVDKDALTQTTIGQALSYFKNWLKPMLRRRFDKKRENYMIGENLEGYWRASARLLLIMTRDFLRDGKLYWNSFTPEEKRNFITAAQETAFMMVSLALLSLAFGFDADDPDKFKKLKNNSYAKNLALLIILGAKNETESLSAMPFFNIEQQAVPPILTEGSKWVKNPTIGFAIIDNTWKTANYTYDLLAGSESAYYKQNMPQYGIEKGDTKAMHYLLKIAQIDDVINQVNPERKIQSMISMMKM